MSSWHNHSGKPLSSLEWLQVHHSAKLKERTEFVKKVLESNPKSVLDLGCGPGLWLGLFDKYASQNCTLIGVDSDRDSILKARESSKRWKRTSQFLNLNFERDLSHLPKVDIILAFNIFPYLERPSIFLNNLSAKLNYQGSIYIRQ